VEFRFAPITASEARAIVGWRYEGPFAAYDCPPDEAEATLRLMLEPTNRYDAARDAGGELVGYCCFGADARVPGGDYADETALDVGLGLRPDLTGRGLGAAFVEAIAAFARTQFQCRHLRLTVAAWNRRAIRAYEKAGFTQTHAFARNDPARERGPSAWVQMTRDDRHVHLVCTRATFRPAAAAHPSSVRWLGPDDYPLALEAWHLRGASLTREDWEVAWPADGYRFAGVVSDGHLVSVAAALSGKPRSPASWELAGVWTRDDVRGQGLATAVCSFVTAHILDSGRIATCTTTRSRPAMLRVAERLGYRRVDR
jgi:RimJ/RimL family protein N-acetyltransferase